MPQQRAEPKSAAEEEMPPKENLTRMEGTAGMLSGVVPEDAEQIMAMQDVPREDDAVPVTKALEPVIVGPPAYGSPDPQTLGYSLLEPSEPNPNPEEVDEEGEPMQVKGPQATRAKAAEEEEKSSSKSSREEK